MAEPTGHFPLATEASYSGEVVDDGSDAGAAGPSTSGLVLSRGALIAIIVVVVVVALFGSKSNQPTSPSILFPRQHSE
jgi:hypothetical protein